MHLGFWQGGHRAGQQQVLALFSKDKGMLPSVFLMLQTTNPNSETEVSKSCDFLLHVPTFTSEGMYPASHQARSRTQPRFPPTTPRSRTWGGKEQLHHPLLPAGRPAEGRGGRTWTSLPRPLPRTAPPTWPRRTSPPF